MNVPSTSLSFQIDQFRAGLRELENDNAPGLVADITQCFLDVVEELLAEEEHERNFQLVPWLLEEKFIDLRVRVCYQNIKSGKRIRLTELDRKIQEVARRIVLDLRHLGATRQLLASHIELLRKFEMTRIVREEPVLVLRQHFAPKNVWEAAEVGAVQELKVTIDDLWHWQRESFVNQINENGSSPLQIAAFRNQVAIMELLLTHKANLLVKDQHGYQALHWTAKGGALDAAIWLIKHNADVNARGEFGRVPLHFAAYNNHPELVALLLNRGANPNAQAEGDGNVTPLHEAVTKNNSLIVELLMRAEAIDVNLRDANKHTPFYYAVRSGHVEIAESLISHLSWRKCLADEADLNHPLELLKVIPVTLDKEVKQYLEQLLKDASSSEVEQSSPEASKDSYAKEWYTHLVEGLDGSQAEQEKRVEEAVKNFMDSEISIQEFLPDLVDAIPLARRVALLKVIIDAYHRLQGLACIQKMPLLTLIPRGERAADNKNFLLAVAQAESAKSLAKLPERHFFMRQQLKKLLPRKLIQRDPLFIYKLLVFALQKPSLVTLLPARPDLQEAIWHSFMFPLKLLQNLEELIWQGGDTAVSLEIHLLAEIVRKPIAIVSRHKDTFLLKAFGGHQYAFNQKEILYILEENNTYQPLQHEQ